MDVIRMNFRTTTLITLIICGLTACRPAGPDNANASANERPGAPPHHRLAWLQDIANNTDVFARGTNLQLMALDSRDGKGERVLVAGPASFNKPLITPDGQRVVFTDHHRMRMHVVNWDGSGLRPLGEGKALAAWRDPATAVTWVYAGIKPVDENALAYREIHRFPLDEPASRELVWDGGVVGEDNFQLSADGQIAGGIFPWPECGILHLNDKRFERLGKGCWTSLAPAHAGLFWIFDGSHRNLGMIDLATRERWNINLGAQPGIDNHEAYHPRWSNHPRYMVATGPYMIRSGGNNIRGGGDNIEIFLGTFSEDFRTIASWTPLTRNQRGDFFPDLWVAPERDTAIARDETSAALHALTGARTRVLWLQDMGDGKDYLARGTQLQLMGRDTDDGRGARLILPPGRSIAKPLFTRDGDRIIFSDRHHHTMHIVPWNGGEPQPLGPGFALHTWRDPETKIEWLYYTKDKVVDGKILQTHDTIFRRALPPFGGVRGLWRLKLSGKLGEQIIWNQTHISEDNYQLSADGRFASAPFPWPHVGVHDVTAKRWVRHGRGCWTGMSPDNRYIFSIFDGPHRNLIMERVGRPGETRWTVNVSDLPDDPGYEVYHPRWSNHPYILAVSGPYKEGEGAYRLTGGGADVEIHVGRFSVDHRSIERWVRVTRNAYANFYPDVWVEPRPGEIFARGETLAQPAAPATDNEQGLIYRWDHAAAQNEIIVPETGQPKIFRPDAKGKARLGVRHQMWLSDGYFTDTIGATPAGTISLVVVAERDDEADQNDAAPLVAWNHDTGLFEADGQWSFKINGISHDLGAASIEGETHLAVVLDQQQITLYVNGRQQRRQPLASPASIAVKNVFFGGHPEISGRWSGFLADIKLYHRALTASDVEAMAGAWSAAQEKVEPAGTETLRARVTEISAIPAPEDIAPYRRGLVVNEYEIIDGERAGERILAAHWAILDGVVLDSAERPLDSEHTLRVALFDHRPELEGERVSMDTSDITLPLHYDLNL